MLREGRLPTSSSPGSPPPSPQIRQTSIKNYFQTDSRRTFERYEVGSGAETRSGPELRSRFGFGFEQSLGDDKSDNEPPERSALNHQPVPMDIMQSQYKLINDSSYPSRALGPYDSEMESPFTNPSAFAAPYAPALKANLSSSIRPTWKYPSPSVSLKLRLAPITLDTVSLLRILNATLFPVQYNEKFYKDVLDTHNDLCWLAFYEEKCVGAICCRRERVGDLWGDISFGAPTPLPQPPRGIVNTNHGQFLGRRGGFGDGGGAGGVERLYIMTLGVLAPFRRTGIGLQFSPSMTSNSETNPASALLRALQKSQPKMPLMLHVQTTNTEAIQFYMRHSFKITRFAEGYYRRNIGVMPPDAYVLGHS